MFASILLPSHISDATVVGGGLSGMPDFSAAALAIMGVGVITGEGN